MGKGNRTRGADKAKEQESRGTSKKLLKVGIWALVIVFTVVLVFGLIQTTGLLQRSLTALKVGDMKMSSMDFNVFYSDAKTSYVNGSYGQYLIQLGYEFSAGFDSFQYAFGEEGVTWRDYFNEVATANATSALVLYQEGKAAGYVISEDDLESLEEYMASFQDAADYYGISVNTLLAQTYGNGTNMNDIRRVNEISFYASSYANSKIDSYEFSADQVEAYYQENKDTYDVVDYYSHTFSYDSYTYTASAEGETLEEGQPQSEEEAEEMTAQSKAQAEAQAQEFIARVNSGKTFDEVSEEYFVEEQAAIAEANSTVVTGEFDTALRPASALTGSGVTIDWIKDAQRKAGDLDYLDNSSANSIIVVQYVSRYRQELPTADVRHILFNVNKPADDATDAEKAQYDVDILEARLQAEDLLAQWKDGEATEESFAQLAHDNTDDSNGEQGGLYERVTPGDMVEDFNSWLFDEARKPGDTDIVLTEYGYHIMYYVGSGLPAYYYDIEDTLVSNAYTEYYDEASENYAVNFYPRAIVFNF